MAQSLEIPIAAGRKIEDEDGGNGIAKEFGLPVAIKPRNSYTLDHLHAWAKVVIGHDVRSLDRALRNEAPGGMIVETVFLGDGIGVSVLAKDERLLQVFQHHREHKPSELGGSSYRVSTKIDAELESACSSMLGSIGYTGVTMFEFIKNHATGKWILLEVNARPWGSLPLPVAAGVDFPYYWYRLLVDGVEELRADYRVGLFGRNSTADFCYLVRGLQEERYGQPARLHLLSVTR